MIYKVLIALAAIYALYHLLMRSHNLTSRVVLACQVIAIGLALVPLEPVSIIGFMLFTLVAVLVVVYGLMLRGLDMPQRVLIISIALPVFVAHLFSLNHWPYAGWIGVGMIVPLICYAVVWLSPSEKFKRERSFLTVFAVDAAIRFTMSMEWMWQ